LALSKKQELFCIEHLVDLNASRLTNVLDIQSRVIMLQLLKHQNY